jgi:hypothetical protein
MKHIAQGQLAQSAGVPVAMPMAAIEPVYSITLSARASMNGDDETQLSGVALIAAVMTLAVAASTTHAAEYFGFTLGMSQSDALAQRTAMDTTLSRLWDHQVHILMWVAGF